MTRKHYLFILLCLGLLGLLLMGSTPQKPYGIPPGAKIDKATVWLYVVEVGALGPCMPVGVFKVEESWDEDTINWGDQPDLEEEPTDWICIDAEDQWWAWDVTDIVQSWVDCTQENYGFAFLYHEGEWPAYGIAVGRCIEDLGEGELEIGNLPDWEEYTPELVIAYNGSEEVGMKLDCKTGEVATITNEPGEHPREFVAFGIYIREMRGFVRFPGIKEPPFVPEAGTMILLGSGLAGLAGYASLRLRARRKREE